MHPPASLLNPIAGLRSSGSQNSPVGNPVRLLLFVNFLAHLPLFPSYLGSRFHLQLSCVQVPTKTGGYGFPRDKVSSTSATPGLQIILALTRPLVVRCELVRCARRLKGFFNDSFEKLSSLAVVAVHSCGHVSGSLRRAKGGGRFKCGLCSRTGWNGGRFRMCGRGRLHHLV